MAPCHVAPFAAIRIALVEQVVEAGGRIVCRRTWVIDPARRGEMEYRPRTCARHISSPCLVRLLIIIILMADGHD